VRGLGPPRRALPGTLRGRFRELPSPAFLGNERNKLVLGNPSPLARCFVCPSWPIAVSPEGIYLPEGVRMPPDGEATRHIAFAEIVAPHRGP